jgi:ubiquitin C-terminal hydrolase
MRVLVLVAVGLALVAADYESIEHRLIDPLRKENRKEELALLSIALILVGSGMALFGLRFLKAVMFFIGFISGFVASFYSVNSFMDSDPALWGVCMAMGCVGGLLMYCFEKAGKCAIGGFFAILMTYAAYLGVLHFIPDHTNATLYVTMAVACVVGTWLGSKAHAAFLILVTAVTGSFGVIFGIDLLTKHQLTYSHLCHGSLDGLGWGLMVLWIVLSLGGVYFQKFFKFSKCRRGKKSQELASPLLHATRAGPMLSDMQATTTTSAPITATATPGRAGLANLGNTCFMNASLQALFAVKPVRQHLLSANRSGGAMSDALASVLSQMTSTNLPSLNPKELPAILRALDFSDGHQHDAFEMTRALINAVIEQAPKGSTSAFKQIFSFETFGVVRCDACGNQSATKEECLDLSLEMPVEAAGVVPLEQLMTHYFKPTVFKGNDSYQCDACNQLTSAKRTLHLGSLPPTLVVSLNRFRYSPATYRKVKLMTQVTIPSTLLVSAVPYSLEAVVVHAGPSTEGGHYYSFARLPEAHGSAVYHWYKCDDRSVARTTFDAITTTLSRPASRDSVYFLLYSK